MKFLPNIFRKWGCHIQQVFVSWNLASKFRFSYLILLILSIVCNAGIIHSFYMKEVKETVSGLTSQTIETISQNVENSLRTISKTSTYLLGTTDVQNYLLDSPSANQAMLAKKLRNSLYLSLEATPVISSILIIHEDGTCDGAARYTLPDTRLASPSQASWYEEVRSNKGTPIFCINGGGYFEPDPGNQYISLIRLINSVEDAKPLGYMILNISVKSLLSFAREDRDNYFDICVYGTDSPMLDFLNPDLQNWLASEDPASLSEESELFISGERYLFLKFQNPTYDWFYLSAIRYSRFSDNYLPFLLIFILTVLISILVFALVSVCTRRFITAPLGRLMSAMKKTETGNFNHAAVTTYKDEIGQLQDAYNEMVDKIQSLLNAKISEQKLLRRAELNTLQEQIKPHFLYNSLNAIAYLITDNQNEKSYELVMSLSDYYRESLSKGSDIIPLYTEISIVKNYLKLQKVRFPDMFEDIYEIQEHLLSVNVPRLFLQPLVENSLYHGILPAGDFGTIKISVYQEQDTVKIHVADDGIGISEKKLGEILGSSLEANKKSFGLRGTIERLRIFYDLDDVYQIKSEPGKGTEIILTFPIPERQETYGS